MTEPTSHSAAVQPTSNSLRVYDIAQNLVDLYWFTQVFDAGGFSVAADLHGLSKSSLSRRLSQLETRLGVQLLHRTAGHLSLTSIGAEVYRHTLQMIDAAQQATNSVQRALETPSGPVNLALPAILSSWLMPLLLSFKNAHPQVQLSIQSIDTMQDTNLQSMDLALSLCKAQQHGRQIVAHPLATVTFVNVASTCSKHPEPLAQILVGNHNDSEKQASNVALHVDNHLNALQATLAGFGYAKLPLFACQTGISTGDLMFINQHHEAHTLFAYTQPLGSMTLATQLLMDYLIQQLSQSRLAGVSPIPPNDGVATV